jgi:AcrR family transcriptional regulator
MNSRPADEGPPTKWQLKREASYDALVRSAMVHFHQLGYGATRVEDITAGTGYTKGAFYFHFENKLDCFWHVIAYRERLRSGWTEIPERHDPAESSLEDVLREAFGRFAVTFEGMTAWVLAMVDCYQQTRGDDEAQARLREIYSRWRDEIIVFVRSLQAHGWVPADEDPALLATQIFAFGEGMTVHTSLYGLGRAGDEDPLFSGLSALLSGAARSR